jgi:hypothetical protein
MQGFLSSKEAQSFVAQYQIATDLFALASEAVAIANFGLLIIGNG